MSAIVVSRTTDQPPPKWVRFARGVAPARRDACRRAFVALLSGCWRFATAEPPPLATELVIDAWGSC